LIISSVFYPNVLYHRKALHSLICADVLLRSCSLTHCSDMGLRYMVFLYCVKHLKDSAPALCKESCHGDLV